MGQIEEPQVLEFAGKRISAVLHHGDLNLRRVVVMAHGFKSSKIGPSRYFVDLARLLAADGISTFRFDQPGSGDSEGSFEDSSFPMWIDSIEHFVRRFHSEGRRVALLGQSMGGVASLAAAARLGDALAGVALWSAAPSTSVDLTSLAGEWMEEEGQRVRTDFWREAASMDFRAHYRDLAAPAYMVFGTADMFIPVADVREVEAMCKPGDRVRVIEGLPHSAWPYPQRREIIEETRAFLADVLAT